MVGYTHVAKALKYKNMDLQFLSSVVARRITQIVCFMLLSKHYLLVATYSNDKVMNIWYREGGVGVGLHIGWCREEAVYKILQNTLLCSIPIPSIHFDLTEEHHTVQFMNDTIACFHVKIHECRHVMNWIEFSLLVHWHGHPGRSVLAQCTAVLVVRHRN